MDSPLNAIEPAISAQVVEAFCLRNRIHKLAIFGSILTPRFRPESDIDILVQFEADSVPGYFGLARMELELSKMVGRKVDLRTAGDLSRHFRDRILATAELQYERV